MTDFQFLDITEAIREILIGEVTLTDSTRKLAQSEVRHLGADNIYNGRRPADSEHDWISILLMDQEIVEDTEAPGACGWSIVRTSIYAKQPRTRTRLYAAVRQTLQRIDVSVTVRGSGTDLRISSCLMLPSGQEEPDDIRDASDEWWNEHPIDWRIRHNLIAPVGVS